MLRSRDTRLPRVPVFVVVAVLLSIVVLSGVGNAAEVGQPAPTFTLASTTGGDISLNDFRGKKFVLLEFYGADFAPT